MLYLKAFRRSRRLRDAGPVRSGRGGCSNRPRRDAGYSSTRRWSYTRATDRTLSVEVPAAPCSGGRVRGDGDRRCTEVLGPIASMSSGARFTPRPPAGRPGARVAAGFASVAPAELGGRRRRPGRTTRAPADNHPASNSTPAPADITVTHNALAAARREPARSTCGSKDLPGRELAAARRGPPRFATTPPATASSADVPRPSTPTIAMKRDDREARQVRPGLRRSAHADDLRGVGRGHLLKAVSIRRGRAS